MRPTLRGQRGQASVELVALLPLLAVLVLALWQATLAGGTVWLAGSAARAAARAAALGADPAGAARRALPGAFAHDLEVRRGADGTVQVRVEIPAAIPGLHLGTVTQLAGFTPQGAP